MKGFLSISGAEIILQGIFFWAISSWKLSLAFSSPRRFWFIKSNSCSKFLYCLISSGCLTNFSSISFFCSFALFNSPKFNFKAVSIASICFFLKSFWTSFNLKFKFFITLELEVNLVFAFVRSISNAINSDNVSWSLSLIKKASPSFSLKPIPVNLPLMIWSRIFVNLSFSKFKFSISLSIKVCCVLIFLPSSEGKSNLFFSRKITIFDSNFFFFSAISGACLSKNLTPSFNLCCLLSKDDFK